MLHHSLYARGCVSNWLLTSIQFCNHIVTINCQFRFLSLCLSAKLRLSTWICEEQIINDVTPWERKDQWFCDDSSCAQLISNIKTLVLWFMIYSPEINIFRTPDILSPINCSSLYFSFIVCWIKFWNYLSKKSLKEVVSWRKKRLKKCWGERMKRIMEQ